jgi:ribonuclease HI
MKYTISYEMAVELVHRYMEKIYALNEHKGTDTAKVGKLFNFNIELQDLINQLRADGHDINRMIEEIRSSLNMKYVYEKLDVYVDGSTRGVESSDKENISGIAFAIFADGKLLHEQTIALGSRINLPKLRNEPFSTKTETIMATNNAVEYMAIIVALEYLLANELTARHIEIFNDCQSVVHQINKVNSTRISHIIRLRNCTAELIDEFENLTVTYISREENDYVDTLLRLFLDRLQGISRDPQTGRRIKQVGDLMSS